MTAVWHWAAVLCDECETCSFPLHAMKPCKPMWHICIDSTPGSDAYRDVLRLDAAQTPAVVQFDY
jgi:hypothetical protein